MKRTSRHSVSALRSMALAPNTLKAYGSDIRNFKARGGSIPATPRMVASYLARSAASLRPATLLRRVAAIAHEHARRGLRSPTGSGIVRETLRGILRLKGQAQRQAKPISPALLQRISRNITGHSRRRNARDRALLLLGFAGGFRRSELERLRWQDVTFSRSGLSVRLRSSKTDPYSRGREIAVPVSQNSKLCAVQAVKHWRDELSKSGCAFDQQSPVFARIDRYDRVHPGLAGSSVNAILKRRLEMAGVKSLAYSAHSLRAGLVTSAASAGVPLWIIQRQTGHKSYSSLLRYVRELPVFELNAVRAVLR
jgi:integrase